MAQWDVFHSERLELVRGLSTEQVVKALASGEVRDDDLVRPSGAAVAWARIADVPELLQPPAAPPAAPPTPTPPPPPSSVDDLISFPVLAEEPAPAPAVAWPVDDDYEDDEEEPRGSDFEEVAGESIATTPAVEEPKPVPSWELTPDDLRIASRPPSSTSHVALPAVRSRDEVSIAEGGEEDEDDEPMISLTRSGPPRVEELDLAAMVDVAFQLVLFFLVTATTILYKTLEIPKPTSEAPPSAVAQGRSRTLDDLKEDYILVEIDAEGNVRLDREPVAADLDSLAEQLRVSREKTGRKTMLLSADFATPHRSAVLAYDAANEIGLGIAIAKPAPPQGPAPSLKPAAPAAAPPS